MSLAPLIGVLAAGHSATAILVLTIFLAATVEMVEALTIVVAVGVTKGWRSALEGAAVALAALALLVLALGPSLARIPLTPVRLIVGTLLLIFGLGWLRKSILRATGRKAKHDEDAIFEDTTAQLRGESSPRDRVGFAVSFKGVFLEGLEVVVMVVTLGISSHRLGTAALAALAAVLCVAIVGVVVARQLSNVPENAMKMLVGIMLLSYGTFWIGEALRITWPGQDLMIVGLMGIYGFVTAVMIFLSRSRVATHGGLR